MLLEIEGVSGDPLELDFQIVAPFVLGVKLNLELAVVLWHGVRGVLLFLHSVIYK